MTKTDCTEWAKKNEELLTLAGVYVAASVTIILASKILNKIFR